MFIYACVASWLALSSLVVPPPATGPAEPSWVDTEPAPPSPGLHARTEVPDDPYLPPATPPRPPEGAPRTPPEGVQVNVDSLGANIPGDAANEPSIAVDPTNPNNIVIGWRQFDNVASNFRQAGYAYSHDAGRHWTFPGVLEPGVFRSDPVLGCDPDGTFFYYSLTLDGSLYTCQTFK